MGARAHWADCTRSAADVVRTLALCVRSVTRWRRVPGQRECERRRARVTVTSWTDPEPDAVARGPGAWCCTGPTRSPTASRSRCSSATLEVYERDQPAPARRRPRTAAASTSAAGCRSSRRCSPDTADSRSSCGARPAAAGPARACPWSWSSTPTRWARGCCGRRSPRPRTDARARPRRPHPARRRPRRVGQPRRAERRPHRRLPPRARPDAAPRPAAPADRARRPGRRAGARPRRTPPEARAAARHRPGATRSPAWWCSADGAAADVRRAGRGPARPAGHRLPLARPVGGRLRPAVRAPCPTRPAWSTCSRRCAAGRMGVAGSTGGRRRVRARPSSSRSRAAETLPPRRAGAVVGHRPAARGAARRQTRR